MLNPREDKESLIIKVSTSFVNYTDGCYCVSTLGGDNYTSKWGPSFVEKKNLTPSLNLLNRKVLIAIEGGQESGELLVTLELTSSGTQMDSNDCELRLVVKPGVNFYRIQFLDDTCTNILYEHLNGDTYESGHATDFNGKGNIRYKIGKDGCPDLTNINYVRLLDDGSYKYYDGGAPNISNNFTDYTFVKDFVYKIYYIEVVNDFPTTGFVTTVANREQLDSVDIKERSIYNIYKDIADNLLYSWDGLYFKEHVRKLQTITLECSDGSKVSLDGDTLKNLIALL